MVAFEYHPQDYLFYVLSSPAMVRATVAHGPEHWQPLATCYKFRVSGLNCRRTQ